MDDGEDIQRFAQLKQQAVMLSDSLPEDLRVASEPFDALKGFLLSRGQVADEAKGAARDRHG